MAFDCPKFEIVKFGSICVEETWFDGDSSTTSLVSPVMFFILMVPIIFYFIRKKDGSYISTVHCGGH